MLVLAVAPRRAARGCAADDDGEIERWRGQAPVIVLGREEAPLDDRVRAFRMGCDDYEQPA